MVLGLLLAIVICRRSPQLSEVHARAGIKLSTLRKSAQDKEINKPKHRSELRRFFNLAKWDRFAHPGILAIGVGVLKARYWDPGCAVSLNVALIACFFWHWRDGNGGEMIEFLAQMPTETKIFLTMAVLGLVRAVSVRGRQSFGGPPSIQAILILQPMRGAGHSE